MLYHLVYASIVLSAFCLQPPKSTMDNAYDAAVKAEALEQCKQMVLENMYRVKWAELMADKTKFDAEVKKYVKGDLQAMEQHVSKLRDQFNSQAAELEEVRNVREAAVKEAKDKMNQQILDLKEDNKSMAEEIALLEAEQQQQE